MSMNDDAAYVEIVHLSDLHFGAGHVFTPEPTPDNRRAASAGVPTLADKIIEDLKDAARDPFPGPQVPSGQPYASEGPEDVTFEYPDFPRILCLSGDFTQIAARDEFRQAEALIRRFTDDPDLRITKNAVFTCPGNHDLAWREQEDGMRWAEYAQFLSRLSGTVHYAEEARLFGGVQVCHEARTVVLSLNSEIKIFDADGERARGDLDEEQLEWARTEIGRLAPEVRREYIKVAMVHHHPVLLPWSAEAKRGYDAILGAGMLLSILHEHEFHVVLHGHKHYPHTFREDVRSAFKQVADHSLFIVAGGTCGSPEFVSPRPADATQTYNRIRIHWCAGERTTRVQVATRGLVKHNKTTREDLLRRQWYWETLAIDDRHHVAGRRPDVAPAASLRYGPSVARDSTVNVARLAEYERTRGAFPVADTFPAMQPGQTAQVHLRIERHWEPKEPGEVLETVTWSAGPKFETVTSTRAEDTDFRATFAYYGGALFQAELTFADGMKTFAYIYVPLLTG